MREARRAEAAWFRGRPEYAGLHPQCGVAALAARLNGLLATHIRCALPALKRQIGAAADARQAELERYGSPPGDDSPDARRARARARARTAVRSSLSRALARSRSRARAALPLPGAAACGVQAAAF